jgi:hypothetical protein
MTELQSPLAIFPSQMVTKICHCLLEVTQRLESMECDAIKPE